MKIDTIDKNRQEHWINSRRLKTILDEEESNQENFEWIQCFQKSYTTQKLLIQFIEQETNTRRS